MLYLACVKGDRKFGLWLVLLKPRHYDLTLIWRTRYAVDPSMLVSFSLRHSPYCVLPRACVLSASSHGLCNLEPCFSHWCFTVVLVISLHMVAVLFPAHAIAGDGPQQLGHLHSTFVFKPICLHFSAPGLSTISITWHSSSWDPC